jgi:hypothetical protein
MVLFYNLVGVSVTIYACIQEVLGSNLGQDTGCVDLDITEFCFQCNGGDQDRHVGDDGAHSEIGYG